MYSDSEIVRIMSENERMIHQVVTKGFHVAPSENRYEDCMQEARLAVFTALQGYDPDTSKYKLSTIIYRAAYNALYEYVPRDTPIMLSYRSVCKRSSMNRKLKAGEELTEKEAADLTEMNKATYATASLNDIVTESNTGSGGSVVTLMDTLQSNVDIVKQFESNETYACLVNWIASISEERRRNIIVDYFEVVLDGGKPNMKQIGDTYGLSRERVRQYIKEARQDILKALIKEHLYEAPSKTNSTAKSKGKTSKLGKAAKTAVAV